MQRICFVLQVKPERLEEYKERHRSVWPEMKKALSETGWHNYSVFLRPDGLLVGYLETEDFARARSGMAVREVNDRWQRGWPTSSSNRQVCCQSGDDAFGRGFSRLILHWLGETNSKDPEDKTAQSKGFSASESPSRSPGQVKHSRKHSDSLTLSRSRYATITCTICV